MCLTDCRAGNSECIQHLLQRPWHKECVWASETGWWQLISQ